MTPGNWHRLDNVCAILSFQLLAVHFADIKDVDYRGGLRWALLLLALWCQEKAPWQILYVPNIKPVLTRQVYYHSNCRCLSCDGWKVGLVLENSLYQPTILLGVIFWSNCFVLLPPWPRR